MIDEPIHFEIVFLDRAGEPGADGVVAVFVEREPRRLESNDRLVAFAERVRIRRSRRQALPVEQGQYKHPPTNVSHDAVGEPPIPDRRRRWDVRRQDGRLRAAGGEGGRGAAGTDPSRLVPGAIAPIRPSPSERAAANYDHPDAYDWTLLNTTSPRWPPASRCRRRPTTSRCTTAARSCGCIEPAPVDRRRRDPRAATIPRCASAST